MKVKSIAKNAIFNVIYKSLNVIFPLISSAYVARVLKPMGVGKVAYAQNIVTYFILIAALGLPTYGLREISKNRENLEKRSKIFSELFILNFISTIICLLIYLLLIFNIKKFYNELSLYIIMAILLAFNWINIDWLYQGIEDFGYIAIRSILIKILSLICLFIFIKNESDYQKYALIICLSTGGNYFFNIIHSHKYVKFCIKDLNILRHIKPVIYLLICTISTELYSKIDITMLGTIHSDMIVGYYSNAQKIINIIITISVSITTVFLPRLSFLYTRDKKKFNMLVNKGLHIVLIITLPCMVGIILVAKEIIVILFGNEFLMSTNTVKILSLLIPIKGIGDLLTYQVIVASNNEKKLVKSYILAALLNIILNIILIPTLKQDGAAIASVLAEFIVFITLLPMTLRVIKIKCFFKTLLPIMSSCILMSFSLILLNMLKVTYYSQLIMKVTVGIIVYFVILILFKDSFIMEVLDILKRKVKKNDV